MKKTNLISHQQVKQELFQDAKEKEAYFSWQEYFDLLEQIISQRIKKNLTQTKLAKKAQTSQSAIARLENAAQLPSLKFLYKLAQALDCQLDIKLKPI